MSNVLIVGDTMRTPELRHEVPLGIPDSFFYAELDGRRVVAISAMEASRVEGLGTGLEVRPLEEFGADGVELRVDQKLFDDRRRRKSAHELAGIRRAQKAAEAGMAAAVDLLRRAERTNGGLSVDGRPLTCELVKRQVQAAFLANGAVAEEMVASHGPQTAIGHDMGSGPIAADDVVLLDLFPVDLESSCVADLTRTFVVGHVPDEIHEWYRLCREALDLATTEVRAGADGGDIHRLVSEFFAGRGFPTLLTKPEGEVLRDGFYHGLGHGVGLEVHESPSLGMLGEELVAGDVITIEPGLYRHGFGGVRVEDLLHVTDDGYELLTDCPYDLEV